MVGGIFTIYFIATAWMTVRRKPGTIGAFDYAALVAALGCAVIDLLFGLEARASPEGRLDGYVPSFFYGFSGSPRRQQMHDSRDQPVARIA